MTTMKIYRVGEMTPLHLRDDYVRVINREFDEMCHPAIQRTMGYHTRSHCFFAAPDMSALMRWVWTKGVAGGATVVINEVEVECDEVFAYQVSKYEQWKDSGDESYAYAYWEGAVPLMDFMENIGDYHTADWEVLLHPSEIIDCREMDLSEVLDHCLEAVEMRGKREARFECDIISALDQMTCAA